MNSNLCKLANIRKKKKTFFEKRRQGRVYKNAEKAKNVQATIEMSLRDLL